MKPHLTDARKARSGPRWSLAKSVVCMCFFLAVSFLLSACLVFGENHSVGEGILLALGGGISALVGLGFSMNAYLRIFPALMAGLSTFRRKCLRNAVKLRRIRRGTAERELRGSEKEKAGAVDIDFDEIEKEASPPRETVVRDKRLGRLVSLAEAAFIVWLFS